jgi:hypothetical protein
LEVGFETEFLRMASVSCQKGDRKEGNGGREGEDEKERERGVESKGQKWRRGWDRT